MIVFPALIGKLGDDIGALPFNFAGIVCLGVAGGYQLFVSSGSPIWIVLIGLGLIGLGWRLQQSTGPTAATNALPKGAAARSRAPPNGLPERPPSCIHGGVNIARRSAVNVQRRLTGITPSPAVHNTVRSLFSDPSKAKATLAELAPGQEEKVRPLFQDAFINGYHSGMWFLLVLAIVTAAAKLFLMPGWRRKPPVARPLSITPSEADRCPVPYDLGATV